MIDLRDPGAEADVAARLAALQGRPGERAALLCDVDITRVVGALRSVISERCAVLNGS